MKATFAVTMILGVVVCLGMSAEAMASKPLEPSVRPILLVATLTPADPPPGTCDPCEQKCAPVSPGSPDGPPELGNLCVISGASYWYTAKLKQVLTGESLPDHFPVRLAQHLDPTPLPDGGKTLWLVTGTWANDRLATGDGGRLVLDTSRWGEPYLLFRGKWEGESEARAPTYLPCSVNDLREEVAARDFPGSWRPTAKLFPFEKADIAAGRATYLHVDARGASPRYGIALLRLRAHLMALGELHREDLRCFPEDWAKHQGKPVAADDDPER